MDFFNYITKKEIEKKNPNVGDIIFHSNKYSKNKSPNKNNFNQSVIYNKFFKRCSSCLSLKNLIKKKNIIKPYNHREPTKEKYLPNYSTLIRQLINIKTNKENNNENESPLNLKVKFDIFSRGLCTKQQDSRLFKNLNSESITEIFGEEFHNQSTTVRTIKKSSSQKNIINLKKVINVSFNDNTSLNYTPPILIINRTNLKKVLQEKSNKDKEQKSKYLRKKIYINNNVKKLFAHRLFGDKMNNNKGKENKNNNQNKLSKTFSLSQKNIYEDKNILENYENLQLNKFYEKQYYRLKKYSSKWKGNKFKELKEMLKKQEEKKNKYLFELKKDYTKSKNDIRIDFLMKKSIKKNCK